MFIFFVFSFLVCIVGLFSNFVSENCELKSYNCETVTVLINKSELREKLTIVSYKVRIFFAIYFINHNYDFITRSSVE